MHPLWPQLQTVRYTSDVATNLEWYIDFSISSKSAMLYVMTDTGCPCRVQKVVIKVGSEVNCLMKRVLISFRQWLGARPYL